jgi:Arc/MetJ family transcription regulator
MRTTVTLDDVLLDEAEKLTGIDSRTELLKESLRALIARESASRMLKLAGSDPKASAPNRRRLHGAG